MELPEWEPVPLFRKRSYEDIQWDMVFEGSTVKCKKCLNSIRNLVLRQNPDMNIASESKVSEQQLSYLDEASNWSIKVVAEAKELANDPTWCCEHLPDETYFVKAIRMGVKELMANYNAKNKNSVSRQKKTNQLTSHDSLLVKPTAALPVEKFMSEFFKNEGPQVDTLKT